MKFYKPMAVLTLLYEFKCWAPKKADMRRVKTPELKFLKSVKGRTRENRVRKKNQDKNYAYSQI